MVKKILFLDILTDDRKLRRESERKVTKVPYSELFRKGMGIKKDVFKTIYAPQEKLPDPTQFAGIIIGGSFHNPIPSEERPWMKKVYRFIKKVIAKKIPLLGVCGGHQFIARALGQKIIHNPKGREFGTIELTLTEKGKKDPLFQGIPQRFKAQLSHQCIVRRIRPNWKLLAFSESCRVQAVAINKQTRIIQFHPEFKAKHLRALARTRKSTLLKEGFLKNEKDFQRFLFSIKETPQATRVLKNFLKYFVLGVMK